MAHHSSESSPADKQEAYRLNRRASQAMVRLIALREPEDYQNPNLDPESYEDFLRREVFRTHAEVLRLDPEGNDAEPANLSLAETMLHPHLSKLAQPGQPLTRERLSEINPAYLEVADVMERQGFSWPDSDVAFPGALPENFNDEMFGRRVLEKRGSGYNNYPAIISAEPALPKADETTFEFMQRTRLYQYATKPYLIRAHTLMPEFMGELQATLQENYPMNEWVESLLRAVVDEHPDPEDALLLRASRLAYELLINLMCKDDLEIQGRLMKLSLQQEITDPIIELWT
jgi:hypothetical protein